MGAKFHWQMYCICFTTMLLEFAIHVTCFQLLKKSRILLTAWPEISGHGLLLSPWNFALSRHVFHHFHFFVFLSPGCTVYLEYVFGCKDKVVTPSLCSFTMDFHTFESVTPTMVCAPFVQTVFHFCNEVHQLKISPNFCNISKPPCLPYP